MWLNIIVLLIAALFWGLLAYRFKTTDKLRFDLALTFAGSYLFGITIIHVIPKLTKHKYLYLP